MPGSMTTASPMLMTLLIAFAIATPEAAWAQTPAADAAGHAAATAVHDTPAVQTQAAPELSAQEQRISEIAGQNGDKRFLMVDKTRGEIILFEDGKPTYSGAALTGAGAGDRIPPKVLTYSGTHPLTIDQKVTPAGRFTVRPENDPEYGRVWTINEVHGKDWDLAIHHVYLGSPSEHRGERIRSPNPLERHITYGCINVERATIEILTRKLPRKASVPLYVLPSDDSLIAAFFPSREIASRSDGAAK